MPAQAEVQLLPGDAFYILIEGQAIAKCICAVPDNRDDSQLQIEQQGVRSASRVLGVLAAGQRCEGRKRGHKANCDTGESFVFRSPGLHENA